MKRALPACSGRRCRFPFAGLRPALIYPALSGLTAFHNGDLLRRQAVPRKDAPVNLSAEARQSALKGRQTSAQGETLRLKCG